MEQSPVFGFRERLSKLSDDGDPLEVLEATVGIECYRGWMIGKFRLWQWPQGGIHHLNRFRYSKH